MSAEAPADHLIATIVTVIGTLMLPLLAPFTVRFLHVTPGPETDGEPQGKVDIESGRRGLKGGIVRCSIACLAMMAVYAKNQVYDEMHMRRVFVLRTENVSGFADWLAMQLTCLPRSRPVNTIYIWQLRMLRPDFPLSLPTWRRLYRHSTEKLHWRVNPWNISRWR